MRGVVARSLREGALPSEGGRGSTVRRGGACSRLPGQAHVWQPTSSNPETMHNPGGAAGQKHWALPPTPQWAEVPRRYQEPVSEMMLSDSLMLSNCPDMYDRAQERLEVVPRCVG